MRASDIVKSLMVRLPKYTDAFTDTHEVRAMTFFEGVNVQTREPHGLKPGRAVTLHGVIDGAGITDIQRVGAIATVTTAIDHDITIPVHKKVTIQDCSEADFNGEFSLLGVDSPTVFRMVVPDSGVTSAADGFAVELGSFYNHFNGTYAVSQVYDDVGFQLEDSRSLSNPVIDSGTVLRARTRVSSGVDLDTVLKAYEAKDEKRWWAFVILEDAFASKDRDLHSDSLQNTSESEHFRQQIVHPVSIYVIRGASEDAVGMDVKDEASNEIFSAICKSVLFEAFDSGLGVGTQGAMQFMTHGTARYDKATYVHAYTFQQTYDLTERDHIDHSRDVSFKRFTLQITPDVSDGTGTEAMQTADVILTDPALT